MSVTNDVSTGAISAKPMLLVVGALLAAAIVSTVANSIQQFGSLAALSNPTVGSNLIIGAVGMVLLLPAIHVGIASIWQSYRNSRSRRNIFFGWGVAITVLQLLILASKIGA